jgi:hypothetical protein
MSDKLLERRDLLTATPARDWAAIGAGLAAAFALVAIFLSGAWALLVLVSA